MNLLGFQLLIGLSFSLLIMVLTWIVSLRRNFFSLVDVSWAYSFGFIAVIYSLTGLHWPVRTFIFASMIFIWSLRLGTHLLVRLKAHYPQEDPRYVELRQKWSKNLNISFLLFFLAQGLSVSMLSLPMALVSLNTADLLTWPEYLGIILWLIGFSGETIADSQLQRFKKDPQNKNKVCDQGLWKLSRHPNYFFEWLIWISYFVFAAASPLGILTFFCPLVMLYLILKVTGVPAAEAQSLKSRGAAYREYQKHTSVFIPWLPKKN